MIGERPEEKLRTLSVMCEYFQYPEKLSFNVWAKSDIKKLTSYSSLLEDTVTKMKDLANFKKVVFWISHSMIDKR